MLQKKFVEKIKPNILNGITFFPENSAIYEIMLENMVQPERPKMTKWHMRLPYWITRAKDTHSHPQNV
jgi:hypothetical protein